MLACNELAKYISENYGECRMGAKCYCLHVGWKMPCPNWAPVEATNYDELRAAMILKTSKAK